MKHLFRLSYLPFFTAGAGIFGFILRLWLFAAIDEKGLLPARHIACTLLYLLSALVLAVAFLSTRKSSAIPFPRKTMRIPHALAYAFTGIMMLITFFQGVTLSAVSLAKLATLVCACSAILSLITAFLIWTGKPVIYPFPALFTVSLILITVALCQVWGAEPQLQIYFFPLLASVFSILTAYQATTLAAGQPKRRLLAFFSQSALFFCCLSLNTYQWPLYLGLAFWAAAQVIPCYRYKKES